MKLQGFGGPAAVVAELLFAALAAGMLIVWLDRNAPPQDLPWRPLKIDQRPGLFTQSKLNAIGGAGCRETLAEAGLTALPQPEQARDYCRLRDTVRLTPTRLAPAQPVMVCRQAAAYAIWERQVVEPAARAMLGSAVVRIEHYGTYACRTQRGRTTAMVSEHASANAIDIAGFVLADGRRITIAQDWADQGPKGRFLRQVRTGACGVFDVTLSPDYNAAHHDHLHLDMGPFRTCR